MTQTYDQVLASRANAIREGRYKKREGTNGAAGPYKPLHMRLRGNIVCLGARGCAPRIGCKLCSQYNTCPFLRSQYVHWDSSIKILCPGTQHTILLLNTDTQKIYKLLSFCPERVSLCIAGSTPARSAALRYVPACWASAASGDTRINYP